MSGKQSAKPRFGGVFFCLYFLFFSPALPALPGFYPPIRAIHHIFQQIKRDTTGLPALYVSITSLRISESSRGIAHPHPPYA
jgi:hypothetical protein